MATINIESVTKSFGEVEVIPPLDLQVADGEFVVLVGPSGCGKTTTLRMIAGLETATTGTVSIGSRDVTQLRPGLRNCAMVFQSYALFPHMTVGENITYGMRVRGEGKERAEEAMKEASRILNLDDYLDRKPAELSGGQRQRVAIGRALVRDPDVFLFDEPLSNLDAKLRIEMRTEIKQLHRRLKSTIVYVTHDQIEAMTMADRVIVMQGGVIEQAADPITLYERPRNAFVASFIGAPSMNMLAGKILIQDERPVFIGKNGIEFPAPAYLASMAGKEMVLGIRPEHTGEDSSLGPSIEVGVVEMEPLGPHTLLIGQVGDEKFTAQVHASNKAQPDDRVTVYLDASKMHFFRASDGVALREAGLDS
ncbi:ABC transporter ATP-binding protein [Granulosicoccus antarcticus]|uniref:sn-glycerol-3-phosphate import ATP-binding protein UgpC n=1 Tax=Granulosicoccus antarcticus IMCC3135 TaxID=1192854 RepID=A0A2Z2P3N0_9GAMM|nr:sn-glycerol-3-phosphate ABC transporter ATP-binding protein UgpC [Granulosicoccus antarcticus]ASJ74404.1 sn-glycerol-3-phosphate import ATP-binding protein UgpC [Granulosicoccus antarcticus IMCC3135]